MGISYSMLASALWPLIALVIPEHQMGTAYGMQVLHIFNFIIIITAQYYII